MTDYDFLFHIVFFFNEIYISIFIDYTFYSTFCFYINRIILFIPLLVPILIGAGFLLFPIATKNFHRKWVFPSILLLSIIMIFSIYLSIQQINNFSIYLSIWFWTINNDFLL